LACNTRRHNEGTLAVESSTFSHYSSDSIHNHRHADRQKQYLRRQRLPWAELPI